MFDKNLQNVVRMSFGCCDNLILDEAFTLKGMTGCAMCCQPDAVRRAGEAGVVNRMTGGFLLRTLQASKAETAPEKFQSTLSAAHREPIFTVSARRLYVTLVAEGRYWLVSGLCCYARAVAERERRAPFNLRCFCPPTSSSWSLWKLPPKCPLFCGDN